MTPWAWMKFTIFVWLLRKTLKLTGWLLLAAVVIAAWPVTVVAGAGYLAAWLRGWPPARLYRTAAWALAASGAWLAAVEVRTPGWRPALLAPSQAWAQSWQGLGATEDERYRIAATADGGIFVLHTPYPEPLVALAGTRRVLETAHKLIGNAWGDEGTTREQHAWTADPNLVRRLEVGQACYIQRGTATFVQVARPRPSPLTLLPPPAEPPPAPAPEPRRDPAPDPWPRPGGLDDFFDPGDNR